MEGRVKRKRRRLDEAEERERDGEETETAGGDVSPDPWQRGGRDSARPEDTDRLDSEAMAGSPLSLSSLDDRRNATRLLRGLMRTPTGSKPVDYAPGSVKSKFRLGGSRGSPSPRQMGFRGGASPSPMQRGREGSLGSPAGRRVLELSLDLEGEGGGSARSGEKSGRNEMSSPGGTRHSQRLQQGVRQVS